MTAIDLESVQRLIEILSCSPDADDVEYDLLIAEAEGCVHALRSLLTEIEQLREENSRIKAAVIKAAEEGLSHD